jgi:hypothetical protein
MFQIILIMIFGVFVFMGSTCTVKEEVKSLQALKAECDNLQVELESLGAKKWTKIIDDKVKTCKNHGFWEFKKRKINTFTDGL